MVMHAIRLAPDTDLRQGLEAYVRDHDIEAAALTTCVGSLTVARLRLANAEVKRTYTGPFEIVSLVGTLSRNGCHLHIAIADRDGRLLGGHLCEGSRVFTTAECVIAELTGTRFTREPDPETGYDELVVKLGD